MLSIFREKYSKSSFFPLFCFFFIVTTSLGCRAQEVFWASSGIGAEPVISVLSEASKAKLVLVGTPFSGGVVALDPKDGHELWRANLMDRIDQPARLFSDMVLIATCNGDLVALSIDDGKFRWRQLADKPFDSAAISPMALEGGIYTLSDLGSLAKYSLGGERLGLEAIDVKVDGTRTRFTSLWRDAQGLVFLDSAGRLRSYDQNSLAEISEKRVPTAVGPGFGLLDGEVLGGVLSAARGWIWTTELSGLLRSTVIESESTNWTAYLGSPQDMYGTDGQIVAVPVLSRPPDQEVLVVTQGFASYFSAESGKPLRRRPLPSPAVAPPIFDSNRQAWWLLTESSLVKLSWSGEMHSCLLPLPERPYRAVIAGDLMVVGTKQGRVYAMPIPHFAEAATALEKS